MDGWDELVARIAREDRFAKKNMQALMGIGELEASYVPVPNPPANSAEITDLQQRLDISFAPDYADFLTYANGWREFNSGIDLFGTQDFWAA